MKKGNVCKMIIGLLFLGFTIQSFAQPERFGIVKGKVTEAKTKEGMSSTLVFLKPENGKEIGIRTNQEGLYEFTAPVGRYSIRASSFGYDTNRRGVNIYEEMPMEIDLALMPMENPPPWETSKPYNAISGFWKPVKYENKQGKIKSTWRGKTGIYFSFSEYKRPGQFSYHDGCNYCRELHFRHEGDGVIELQENAGFSCTAIGCSSDEEIYKLVTKMQGRKTNTRITDSGQTLEFELEDETFVFQKVHDNTRPKFSKELFGKWKSIEGKLEGEIVSEKVKGGEIFFGWSKKYGMGRPNILYKDENCKRMEMDFVYRYLDKDFVSLYYYSIGGEPDSCYKEFMLDKIFRKLSSYGCSIIFDESKKKVTLEYGDNRLVMKRM